MMRTWYLSLLLAWGCVCAYGQAAQSSPAPSQRGEDARRLGMALEYFASGKYHEALLIFDKLDARYRLNPRYTAYIGVCHYYEWNYEQAIAYLDKAIPRLEVFSPSERSFYYWANAESHFHLSRYSESIPLYETMLTLCHDNEKPDAYYRLGFCHMFAERWAESLRCFQLALQYYQRYRDTADMRPRIAQITHMIEGCKQRANATSGSIPTSPSPAVTE